MDSIATLENTEHAPSQQELQAIEKELERGSDRPRNVGDLIRRSMQRYPAIRDKQVYNDLHRRWMQMTPGPEKTRLTNELVARNANLVFAKAQQYQGFGVRFEDLVQEGLLVIYETVLPRYDPDRGVAFASYALWWIRQAMQREISKRRLDRPFYIPEYIQLMHREIGKHRQAFTQKHGREPSDAELAESFGLTLKQYCLRIKNERGTRAIPLSINMPIHDDVGAELQDVLDVREGEYFRPGPWERHLAIQQAIRVSQALTELKPSEQEIIRLHYGLGGQERSLQEIGDQRRLTRERIRQIESASLKDLASKLDIVVEEVIASLTYGDELGLYPESVCTGETLVITEELAEKTIRLLQKHIVQRPSDPLPRIPCIIATLSHRLNIDSEQAESLRHALVERKWLGPSDVEGSATLLLRIDVEEES